jgi:hypothetical protein
MKEFNFKKIVFFIAICLLLSGVSVHAQKRKQARRGGATRASAVNNTTVIRQNSEKVADKIKTLSIVFLSIVMCCF